MKRIKAILKPSAFLLLTLALPPATGRAQYFEYSGKGDLLAGFRKPGVASYELVVNLGNVTNFEAQAAGSTVSIGRFSPAQLSDAFSAYNNLQWSAFATFTGPPNSSWAGYPLGTIWFTLPRSDAASPSSAPSRRSSASQAPVVSEIDSIGRGARTISSGLGTTNADNNLFLVREPTGDRWSLSVFIADPTDVTLGDFAGNMPSTVENTTAPSFTSAARSDLYQSVPLDFTDPNTGETSGNAYFIGYFTLNPDGTMTFTRASAGGTQPPPAPKILSIARAGAASTISFTTASGGLTYSLYYTNSMGLEAPVASWALSAATLKGDGAAHQFTDNSTDPNRFYRVAVRE